jgi:hypothetical protein
MATTALMRAKEEAKADEAAAKGMCDPAVAPGGSESVIALTERVAAWLDAQKAPPEKPSRIRR